MDTSHQPVLLKEVIQAFDHVPLQIFIDGTVGAGGHAEALLERHAEIQTYLALDQDLHAIDIAQKRLQQWENKVVFKHGNFAQIDEYLNDFSLAAPNGILVDLGVSSMQLDQSQRGFSFMQEGPLDMRMNSQMRLTAADIVNEYSEQELGKIFRDYGEERHWRIAARTIVENRKVRPFVTTTDLKVALIPVLARYYTKKAIHPLTLIFQALRICVNQELEKLDFFLSKALDLLTPGGRLAVISFHSLEDRIVKNQMRFAASDKWETTGLGVGLFRDKEPIVKLITKKPIEPSEEEKKVNPRCRSAKLRVVEKLRGSS